MAINQFNTKSGHVLKRSLCILFSALLSVSADICLPDWTKIYSSYKAERDGLGEEDEDKKARDCEMSPDMEADAEKRRCRANREDDTAEEGKSASFYWSAAALFQFQTFFSSSTALTQVASTTSEKVHFLSMWSRQSLSASMDICWFRSIYCLPAWQLSYRSICQPLCLYMPVSLSHHFYDDLDDDSGDGDD